MHDGGGGVGGNLDDLKREEGWCAVEGDAKGPKASLDDCLIHSTHGPNKPICSSPCPGCKQQVHAAPYVTHLQLTHTNTHTHRLLIAHTCRESAPPGGGCRPICS